MHIKRFEASTLEAALAAVRDELGPDALILSSRTLNKQGGPLGLLGRQRVEVQAARERSDLHEEAGIANRNEAPSSLSDCSSVPRIGASDLGRGDADRGLFEREIRDELRALRAAVTRLEAARAPTSPWRGEPVAEGVEAVIAERLDPAIASSLIDEWRGSMREDPSRTLLDVLRRRLSERCAPPRAVDGRRVRFLVGAAGVGKTTSLAKLAARNEEGERDVLLASLDEVRVGASEGLRRYAEILGAPYQELNGLAGLGRLLNRRFRGEILVDTAGQSPRQPGGTTLAELREKLGRRIEIDLVIDASARPSVQRAQLERFAALEPDRVILTRRDELDDPAAIPNLVLDSACPPISWCGTGQRVPDDFELAEPDRLLHDLMGRAA